MPHGPPVRPLLLLHGWGGSFNDSFAAHGWLATLSSTGRRVVAVDLPGHGPGAQSHRPADYADLAGTLLAYLPDEPTDVVGYSLGAKLMLEMALRAPARFGTLVAGGIGDNIFAREPAADEVIGWLTSVDPRAAPHPLGAVLTAALDQGRDPLALAAVLGRPANPQLTEARLATLALPLHLIVGDADQVAGPGHRLAAALPGLVRTNLAGVGHFDLLAAPSFPATALRILETAPAGERRRSDHRAGAPS